MFRYLFTVLLLTFTVNAQQSTPLEGKAINGIIELLTLYSDEEMKEAIKIKTDNIQMSNFKAVLSAA